ncbi:beta-glucosidase [Motilibacter rhizosphaerae]|uniref:Beta-glucosidase n=1 Tax=Motilibacter rhizosphaerae TaxID=598652 RepID=A0A4Q7NWI0_9ACTN|nr:glycoside hydrolase family 3 N-terminal domain-containing protein [Motilibacter rhizosphaerae]RZS91575.1 beta-glucosidase [Motilibacter rhizosphaerae]
MRDARRDRHAVGRRTGRRWVPLTAALATALAAAGSGAASAATTDPNPGPLETANAALSRHAATQGMVLLENHDSTLPMARGGNVALFGVGAYKTVKGGTGSGDVYNRYTINVRQGLEGAGYTVTTSDAYWNAMTSAYDTKYPASATGQIFGPAVDYSSVEQLLTPDSVKPKAPTSTAIYVVARNSGEGADRSATAGDYYLTDTEKADLALLGQSYQHVVVVLNTGGVMDTAFYKQINASEKDPSGGTALDSLLLMSQAGQESGNALADVLDGAVDPSGHLTDTWASAYSFYPASATFGANDKNTATEPYAEGIYVGYRYFDSFYKTIDAANPAGVVDYPFGYGLSYTTFRDDVVTVQSKASKTTVKVKVTNTGTRSGKQVVQVYFSAPQTGPDKPYQQLAGYAKTDELGPGQSEHVDIAFDTTQMASYDTARAAWVLDAGDYLIRVGDSSRSTHVAARLTLPSTVVTEQDHNELADDEQPSSELHSDPSSFYSYAGEQAEIAKAPHLTIGGKFRTVQAASPYEQSVPVDPTSPYYAVDGSLISRTTAYVDPAQSDWAGTGAPYAPKTGETVQAVKPVPGATLYDVAKGTVSMQQFVAGLSLDQLSNIVEGANTPGSTPTAVGAAGYTTAKYESLGIPGTTESDGPAGLRITQQIPTTPTTYQWTTAWPIGTLLAQTWDRDLVQQVGDAVGKEMTEYGATLWLAPGMNIHRDPLNGRNFEYYSEDPLVAGLTAAATTKGVQSNPGVGVTLKHYAENSQEANRNADDAVVSERAAREIELKGFEIAVKSAQPMAIMTSYNKINGTWASRNYDLVTDILHGEWGFKGLVMTDWGGSHGAANTMYAGNDLIMPGNNPGEVVNAAKKVTPTLDVDGLPAYTRTLRGTSYRYTWSTGNFTLSGSGTQTISTRVDGTTDLSHPVSGTTTTDATGKPVLTPNAGFASVDGAYQAVQAEIASTAHGLSADQRAGITLTDVVHQVPGDATSPVTAFTVVLKGTYPASYDLRLGDLQRSASRILAVVAQSLPFQQLAALQGVSGITVAPYTSQFTDLATYVAVDKDRIR